MTNFLVYNATLEITCGFMTGISLVNLFLKGE